MKPSSFIVLLTACCLFTLTYQQDESAYTPMDTTKVRSDKECNGAMDFGTKIVVKEAIAAGKIANDTYTVSEIVSVFFQKVTNGAYYKFSLKLSNSQKVFTLNTNFTCFAGANETFFLKVWSYQHFVVTFTNTATAPTTTTETPKTVATAPTTPTKTIPVVTTTKPVTTTPTTTTTSTAPKTTPTVIQPKVTTTTNVEATPKTTTPVTPKVTTTTNVDTTPKTTTTKPVTMTPNVKETPEAAPESTIITTAMIKTSPTPQK